MRAVLVATSFAPSTLSLSVDLNQMDLAKTKTFESAKMLFFDRLDYILITKSQLQLQSNCQIFLYLNQVDIQFQSGLEVVSALRVSTNSTNDIFFYICKKTPQKRKKDVVIQFSVKFVFQLNHNALIFVLDLGLEIFVLSPRKYCGKQDLSLQIHCYSF